MTDATTAPAETKAKPPNPLMIVRQNIEKMAVDFKAALPAHIPAERFVRTALTAVTLNPDIVECEPRTIYAACMKAAQDGLVLDGREAALVKFSQKMKIDGVEKYVPAAQYMPMVQGILKKARNSGEISSIAAHVVHEKDKFTLVLGDNESLTHEPCLEGDPGPLRLAYMVAKLKDGSIVREVMTASQINKVRASSRSGKSGPWVAWEDEMWRKTVLRRGAKYLPSSSDRSDGTDVIDLVSRDDGLFEMGPGDDEQPPATQPETRQRRPRQPRQSTGPAGAILNPEPGPQPAQEPAGEGPTDIDPETGEILTGQPAAQQQPSQEQPAAQPQQQAQPAQPAQAAAAAQPKATPAATAPTSAAAKLNAGNDDGMDPPGFLTNRGSAEPPPPDVDDVI